MGKLPNSGVGSNEVLRYLTSGKQTEITPEIEKIALEIDGSLIEKVQKILNIGPSLVTQEDFSEEVFRKRTASQILQDGYITGCTDAALLFLALTRACGISAKYIETIDRKWLDEGGDVFEGHVYAQIYDGKEWIWVDPMKREIGSPPGEERMIVEEGLDSWDIGIYNFNSLKRRFEEYKKQAI